jgi:methionyl-tRNA formyltransferase
MEVRLGLIPVVVPQGSAVAGAILAPDSARQQPCPLVTFRLSAAPPASGWILYAGSALVFASPPSSLETTWNSTLLLHAKCSGLVQRDRGVAGQEVYGLADGTILNTMRIEFLTQDDPLYVFPFFDEFVRHYAEEFKILQISTSRTMGKRPRAQLLKELSGLYGCWGMARLLARAGKARMLGTLPKKKGVGRYSTLRQLCHAYDIPYEQIGNPNASSFVESVTCRAPDLLISVACPYIVKDPLLNVPSLGAINIHHAPLPRYKGMMPTFWQMFHGEKVVGLTIHNMVLKLDEGDALFQDDQPIQPGESLDQLIQRSKRHGAHCVARVLRQVRDGSISAIPLDHSKGSYFTFPNSEEIAEFRRRGFRAI